MLTLRIKPKKIEETDNGPVNRGGRDLRPEESPTGEAIKAGTMFEAPEDWYLVRRHWHFLTVVDKTDESETDPLDMDESESNDVFLSELESGAMTKDAWDAIDWHEFRGKVSDLGVDNTGSRVAIMKRLDEEGFIAPAE